MPYDESQVRELARALLKAVDAAKDGVGLDDLDEAKGLMKAVANAADEAKDTDAFALHLISELADQIGDRRVDSVATDPA